MDGNGKGCRLPNSKPTKAKWFQPNAGSATSGRWPATQFKNRSSHAKLPDPCPQTTSPTFIWTYPRATPFHPAPIAFALEVLGLDNSGQQSSVNHGSDSSSRNYVQDRRHRRNPNSRPPAKPLAVAKAYMQITPVVTRPPPPLSLLRRCQCSFTFRTPTQKNVVQGVRARQVYLRREPRLHSPACPGGTLGGKLLQLDFIVPPGVQKATATLRLQSSQLASTSEIPYPSGQGLLDVGSH